MQLASSPPDGSAVNPLQVPRGDEDAGRQQARAAIDAALRHEQARLDHARSANYAVRMRQLQDANGKRELFCDPHTFDPQRCAAAKRDVERVNTAMACDHVMDGSTVAPKEKAACESLCESREPALSGPSLMPMEDRLDTAVLASLTLGEMYRNGWRDMAANHSAAVEKFDRACVLGEDTACASRDRLQERAK